MTEEVISDAILTKKLQDVFGIENVAAPDHSRGFHEIYFPNKKAASDVLSILDSHGFLSSMQSSGGWVAEQRPNIGIICGNESQRIAEISSTSKNAGLNEAATQIMDILDNHKAALQTAAGIGAAPYRG